MKPSLVWIGLVVGLLVLGVLMQVVLLFAAVNDPSFAVEPDYEQKALDWDRIQRQRAESAGLGWSVSLETWPAGAPGLVEVELTLADRFGRPIDGAEVRIEAFHNARASRIEAARLPCVEAGRYRQSLPLGRPGLWEFRLEVEHDAERYTGVVRQAIANAPRAGGR